jgi:feruloyl esterase
VPKPRTLILGLSVSTIFALTTNAAFGQTCSTLANLRLDRSTIVSASEVAAAEGVPAHCRVVGTIEGTIGFELLLPEATAWNGKFNGVGNGALAGFINTRAMHDALARGYATASTDTGHIGHPVPGAPPFPGFDASWALDAATGELNLEALENFGHRGIHEMTRVAKAIVQAHYSTTPRYAYFTGCSNGGQQGLAKAQRHPADYDGIVSGAPANHPTSMWPGESSRRRSCGAWT